MSSQVPSDTKPRAASFRIANAFHTFLSLRELNKSRDLTVLAVGASISALFILLVSITEQCIVSLALARGYSGPTKNLDILDTRFGCTPGQVFTAFSLWGPQGRWLYVLIEVVDILVYFRAYVGVGSVLFNRLADSIAHRFNYAKQIAILPLVLCVLDTVEDVAQLACVFLFEFVQQSQQHWVILVSFASFINQMKWRCVTLTSLAFFFEVGIFVLDRLAALTQTHTKKL